MTHTFCWTLKVYLGIYHFSARSSRRTEKERVPDIVPRLDAYPMAESFIAALSEREDNHYILVHYGRSKDPESG